MKYKYKYKSGVGVIQLTQHHLSLACSIKYNIIATTGLLILMHILGGTKVSSLNSRHLSLPSKFVNAAEIDNV